MPDRPRCGCGLRCKMDAPSVSWRSIRSNRRRPKPIRELERIFESRGAVEVGNGSIPRDPTHEYRVNPKLLEWVQRLDPTDLRWQNPQCPLTERSGQITPNEVEAHSR